MSTLLKVFIGSLLALFSLTFSIADAETTSLRFKDSEINMPPGNSGKSLPGLGAQGQQSSISNDTIQLILARMALLEKKLDLMENRLRQLEGGGK